MFSKTITNSSDFLMMSQSAQNLYFHFGMNADDDGFCEVFTIMRMTDSKPDDLRSLHEKGFLFVVDSKVCIIKDWHENNQLRLDRYKKSSYLTDQRFEEVYAVVMQEKIKEIDQYKPLLEKWQPNGNQMATQVRIVEASLGEESKGKGRKDNSEADAPQSQSPLVIKAMEEIDSKNKNYYGNKTQRKACDFLVEEYGLPVVLHVIENVLPQTNQRPRFEFPHISTPHQLMEHWVKVKDGIKTKKNEVEKMQSQVAF